MIGVCNINNNNVVYSPMKQGKKSVHTLEWVKTGGREDNEEKENEKEDNTNYYLYSCGKDNKLLEHHFNNSTKVLIFFILYIKIEIRMFISIIE